MRIANVVIDCPDPARLAPFWEAATGYQRVYADEYFIVLTPGAPGPPNLLLQRVPEPKVGKNRVHVDLATPDMDGEVRRMESLGATRGETFEMGVRWTVMSDPEGNEFCISLHAEEA
jgi:hypothetical protein